MEKYPIFFDYANANEIKIDDGCIKSIFVQNENKCFDERGRLELSEFTGGGEAVMELVNGKRLMINVSEWAQLIWIK